MKFDIHCNNIYLWGLLLSGRTHLGEYSWSEAIWSNTHVTLEDSSIATVGLPSKITKALIKGMKAMVSIGHLVRSKTFHLSANLT
mgnify:CR=1 FL=1